MLLEQGWLVGARRVPSPHYDCRPDDETPTLLVVHTLACRQASLAVRGSTHYSLELLIRRHILSLLRSPICASPLTV